MNLRTVLYITYCNLHTHTHTHTYFIFDGIVQYYKYTQKDKQIMQVQVPITVPATVAWNVLSTEDVRRPTPSTFSRNKMFLLVLEAS